MKLLNKIFFGFSNLFRKVKRVNPGKYLVKIKGTVPVPSFNPLLAKESGMGLIQSASNPEVETLLVRQNNEVIGIKDLDGTNFTAEQICERMSQAAADIEFPRVIVYPISGELRKKVLDIMDTYEGKRKYPMFEYKNANITNNDDLNSRTILYKYVRSEVYKPI